jgi:hypothetical protein
MRGSPSLSIKPALQRSRSDPNVSRTTAVLAELRGLLTSPLKSAYMRVEGKTLRPPNDEVEQRGNALPTNEAKFSQSSTPSLAQQRRNPCDRPNRLLEAMRRPHNRTKNNSIMLNKLHGCIAAQASHLSWRWRHLDHVHFGIFRIHLHGVFVVPSRQR